MKTTNPHNANRHGHNDQDQSLIDTSKMSAGERAALEMAEAARDRIQGGLSFGSSLFMGKPRFASMVPFPRQAFEDKDQGDAFLVQLREFLENEVDADAIDRTGEIPDNVIDGLARLGAFGIKIPVCYCGLGLSQTNYARAAMLLGRHCGNLTALLSAHQSIGVPQPLLMFGTNEQKQRFLPRCASGEISAFALTEQGVGSDPAQMSTIAKLTEDGMHYILNGEKLWCTNGTKAGLIVVMARTSGDGERAAATAFIVETDAPGVEVLHRCHFMGLRALYNGVIRFDNVRVPRENVILGEGKGLKVALSTLNTGRITVPAACVGLTRRCLEISRKWASERVQWGAPIIQHEAIAEKIARMSADTFALEAIVRYVSALVDRDKKADIRIEAAMAKLWGTETTWRIVDDTMQIRGGRGFETADSLRARGDRPDPVERFLRDSRINTIFEGSSEIMRLFLAREALDPHLQLGAAAVNTTLPWRTRMRAAVSAGLFYAGWYPKQWMPRLLPDSILSDVEPEARKEMKHVARLSRKLARSLFQVMLRHGPKLNQRQLLLGRFVDIGTELFAMSVTAARASELVSDPHLTESEKRHITATMRVFCKRSRLRVKHLFADIRSNADKETCQLAQETDS
ncbi:MAG: alkylation response protein AidB-like acyl-CoA dehydrogenase [Verrucomicrobiales bacterium]|jgi:alkylation response protein AidB-like acyl-CoA dehydrogenase